MVIEGFFDKEVIAGLQAIYNQAGGEKVIDAPFFTTHWVPDKTYREQINKAVSEALNASVLPLLNNYKNIFGYFLSKAAGANNEVTIHRDWSVVDESIYTGINAWIPLCDMNKDNGCFQVAEGSHLNYGKVRGSNIDIDYNAELHGPLTDVVLKAGDLLLFDQKLLHASPENSSQQVRVAAGMVMIPAETHPVHYSKLKDGEGFMRLGMADNFLTETFFSKSNPEQLTDLMQEHAVTKVALNALPDINRRETRAVFINSAEDGVIEDKGFFTGQLLSEEQVGLCLDTYYSTQSGMEDKFYNTIASNNLDYRKKVNDRLEEILGNTVRAYFNNYQVLGYNFAAKSYGEGSMCHIHNDDSHADETLHRCINVWIPLVDVSDRNGSLYVLPGSHKLPYTIRGIGLPFAYEKYLDVIEPRLQVMELKAGEALFFDARLIHGSYENKLMEDRPAIILAMLPAEAEPEVFVKYSNEQQNTAELFEAPFDFYLNMKIGERPVGYKSKGVFTFSMADIEEEDFMEIIR